MAHDVFISYSSKDKPVADAAVAALETRGIRCWIAPRDIVGGTDWSEAIIEAINTCRVMLLVFSQNANTSHQIKREVERAVAKGVPVIPLRIEDVPLAKSLEYFISMPHWIDALTPERQQRLDYLAETVGLLLERQGARVPDERPATPRSAAITSGGGTRPAGSRPGILVGALALIAAIVVVAIYLWPEPPPPPPIPSGLTAPADPAPRGEAPIDPRLAGRWAATITTQGVTTQGRLDVEPDGRFRWEIALEDSGAIQAANGGALQTSAISGAAIPIQYSFRSPELVTISGPLGTADWRRVRAGGAGGAAFDGRLAGTWESSSVDAEGHEWTSTLEMSPAGYSFRSVMAETGTMRTTGSRYASTSDKGVAREGDMTIQGADVVVMRDDTTRVAATWKRRP